MKSTSRRDFLKKSFLASASALAVPSLLNSCKDVETFCRERYTCVAKR